MKAGGSEMNIIVCMKQTPDTERDAPDYVTGTWAVDRGSCDRVANVFDTYALEVASRLKDAEPGSVLTALTIGPEESRAVLKEALSISADGAYHVCDDEFSGVDAPATARVLAAAVRRAAEQLGGVDVVFCGKLSSDGETSVVPVGLATELDMPYVSGCLEALVRDGSMLAVKEQKSGCETIEVQTPCVISCVKPNGSFKFPTIKRKLAANRAVIPALNKDDIKVDTSCATKVINVYAPERVSSCTFISGETAQEAASELAARMFSDGVI